MLLPSLCLPASADNQSALSRLRAGEKKQAAGDLSAAWREWQLAYGEAYDNYLSLEALAKMVSVSQPRTRDWASTLGRLMAYFGATPPRWLSDPARKIVSTAIDQRVAEGIAPTLYRDPGVRAVNFAAAATGLGFRGQRYAWMAHLEGVPPPVADYLVEGEPIQADVDQLPVPRLPAGADRWSLVDPRHAKRDTPAELQAAWRFDRCLVGYTFEPIEKYRTELGVEVNTPIDPWYDGQQAIWQLRFRLFYPSEALGGADLHGLAENLMDALLRAAWIGVETLGREAWDGGWKDQVVDVWLTPNAADEALHAGGERWLNNLYFYQAQVARTSVEWVREACHEYGHVMMPRIGRYPETQACETWMDGPLGERLLLRGLAQSLDGAGKEPLPAWMADLKRRGFLVDYRRQEWEPALTVWRETGPGAPERLSPGDRGARWVLGFGLWIADAHDAAFLYDLFRLLSPNSQYPSDGLMASYLARLRDREQYTMAAIARVADVGHSPAAEAPGGLAITDQSTVEYLAHLTEGRWEVRFLSAAPSAVSVTVGDGPTRLIETGVATATAPPLSLTAATGWYRFRLTGFGAEPTVLKFLSFTSGRAAHRG